MSYHINHLHLLSFALKFHTKRCAKYLGKGFLKKYDFLEIFEDGSGVCHVRVVGAKRRPLLSTELEKTECKTKKMTKSLFAKSGHGTEEHKRTHGSCDTWLLDGKFDGSPEHIVQYLYDYLSTHLFPIWMTCVQLGCTVLE